MNRQSRRRFLQSMGGISPAVTLTFASASALPNELGQPQVAHPTKKSTPVDLSAYFTASSSDFGAREPARELKGKSKRDGLIRTPGGLQVFRGLPFALGPPGIRSKSWLVLSNLRKPWLTAQVEIPLQHVFGKTSHICLAAFCDWDPNELPPPHAQDVREKVGQLLAHATFVYQDGVDMLCPSVAGSK
jgi:hypothetical protein